MIINYLQIIHKTSSWLWSTIYGQPHNETFCSKPESIQYNAAVLAITNKVLNLSRQDAGSKDYDICLNLNPMSFQHIFLNVYRKNPIHTTLGIPRLIYKLLYSRDHLSEEQTWFRYS